MQLAMIGLGRMGANIVRRLMRDGGARERRCRHGEKPRRTRGALAPTAGRLDDGSGRRESKAPSSSSALHERFRSRETESFADKIVSAKRKGFGGLHEAKVD